MNANLGELDLLRDLAARLAAAPHGGRTAMVDAAAQTLRVSRQEVYRRLAAVGFSSGRKPRADRGRCMVDEDVAKKAAALVQGARRKTGKKTMPLSEALEILRENGVGQVDQETGEVVLPQSSTTLSRAMRKYGCHPAMLVQGKPHSHMQSPHPNWCWQIDASLCVCSICQGWTPGHGGRGLLQEQDQELERVARERVWRYVVTDHYSGALSSATSGAGENAENSWRRSPAMQPRGMEDPMHGVRGNCHGHGSANTSISAEFLQNMKVNVLVTSRESPGKGSQQPRPGGEPSSKVAGLHAHQSIEELQAGRTSGVAISTPGRAFAHGRSRNSMW
jgi:hypothetical protein